MQARIEESDSFADLGEGCPSSLEGSDRITLVGLIFESAIGLRRSLAGTIEAEFGITGQSFDILLRLYRSPEGRLRMSDLSAQTGFTPSGLTRAIDRLVEAGFLERSSCVDDRRGSFAQLTELGRRRTGNALEVHQGEIDEILDDVLSAQDEETLVHLLRLVRNRVRPDAALISPEEDVAEVSPAR